MQIGQILKFIDDKIWSLCLNRIEMTKEEIERKSEIEEKLVREIADRHRKFYQEESTKLSSNLG